MPPPPKTSNLKILFDGAYISATIPPMTLAEMGNVCRKLIAADLTLNVFVILLAIRDADLSMTGVARLCNYSTAASTGTIDRMEKRGFVQRIRPVDDRRTVMVKITGKGLEKLNSIL